MDYRNLHETEIKTLKQNGCSSDNWENIKVTADFIPDHVQNVQFRGQIRLGRFADLIEIEPGISKPGGIFHSFVQDCTIADNVYISQVKNLVGYHIESEVAIENVGNLIVRGQTTFGNGTRLEILNEGGGRELPIFDQLSAQIAYLMVLYQQDPSLISTLNQLVDDYVLKQKSNRGMIGQGARLQNCSEIRNVKIGPASIVTNTLYLEEGTIASSLEAPTMVGEGVVAKNFIILDGSQVDGGAMLSKCFVGQGVRIGKQYSAENSAFFANSEAYHGEACSIFAGPYTVTHHKSTLLIAGLFSFYNAGSGTNQSNHMYKLGPLHQGILERGSKTGSFSYLLWPCRIGAFTAVIGKHYSNFDTADMPFSYINEVDGKSILTPAMNLFTVGTRRDSTKWPQRDRRKMVNKLDLINFDFWNPYLMGKVIRGYEILKNLYEKTPQEHEFVTWNGIQIKRLMLRTTSKYYEMAIKIYIGHEVLKRLEPVKDLNSMKDILESLKPTESTKLDNWVDLSGMFLPRKSIDELLLAIKTDKIAEIDSLHSFLRDLFVKNAELSWNWCAALIEQRLQVKLHEITIQQLTQIIRDWIQNAIKLNNMIMKDAEKEFDIFSRIGFGIDGDNTIRDKDFEAVRGTYQGNKFILELRKESEEIQRRGEELIRWLEEVGA
ncbi:DUF4954 family protein [candidate division KSB1 bacterium]|nr:DUF4954 family protein [candidate division KSB1 bacterium]